MKFVKPSGGLVNSLVSGARMNPVLGVIRPHNGVDYTSSPNNDIVASAAGKVIIARSTEDDGYGKMVAIEHDFKDGLMTTVYAHLSVVSVKLGQVVRQGQKIGVKGTTGNSTGVHLHFEIRQGKYAARKYINPLPLIFDKETQTIQVMLNKVGYILRADGYYGDETINAVALFQKKHGMTVDGVAGRTTFSLLKSEAAKVPKVEVDKGKGGSTVTNPKDDGQHAKAAATHLASQEWVIATGISNGEYPADNVTRQQIWSMLKSAHDYTMKEVEKLQGK